MVSGSVRAGVNQGEFDRNNVFKHACANISDTTSHWVFTPPLIVHHVAKLEAAARVDAVLIEEVPVGPGKRFVCASWR